MSMRRLAVPVAAALALSIPATASAVNTDAVQQIIAQPEGAEFPRNMLDALPEVSQGSEGFNPDEFSEWVDYNKNGCPASSDILYYLLPGAQIDACQVTSGQIIDPYSGEFAWLNSPEEVKEIVLDHVVSPEQAWRSGAWSWSEEKRAALYNDPLNIKAVFPETARDRAGRSAEAWLPEMDPDSYARLQIRIKHKYGLGVSATERAALASAIGVDLSEYLHEDQHEDQGESMSDNQPDIQDDNNEVIGGDDTDRDESGKVGPLVDTGGQVAPNWFSNVKGFLSKLIPR